MLLADWSPIYNRRLASVPSRDHAPDYILSEGYGYDYDLTVAKDVAMILP